MGKGGHVWADRFDRDLKEFRNPGRDIQGHRRSLKVKLLPKEKKAIESAEPPMSRRTMCT